MPPVPFEDEEEQVHDPKLTERVAMLAGLRPVGAGSVVPVDHVDPAAGRFSRAHAAALCFTALAGASFALVRPPVGDFWAAQARRFAALHGVGLHYWFAWFGGTVPGHYSVLAPSLTRIIDPAALGAAATVASVVLTGKLLAGTRHRVAASWFAAVGATFSLWSGRIPFALGTVFMLAGLLAVRSRRPTAAAGSGLLTALISPVSAAFLVLGLVGVVLQRSRYRVAALMAAGGAGCCLLAIAGYFGLPGHEGFPRLHALLAAAALALMLTARPPTVVRTVLLVSLAACPLLVFIPNGMGTNFERFTWILLPVAVVASGQARRRTVVAACAAALACSVIGSLHDLYVAAQPMSTTGYTSGLAHELDHTPGHRQYRLEIVPDGTHVSAYSLLGHAMLARGYETQSDNSLDAVLHSPRLDAADYRSWLDANAVAYVALDRRTLASGPEDHLVRSATPGYLRLAWSDTHWLLFAVAHPHPIAARPARIVDADQADLKIETPAAGRYALRVRWSRFLQAQPATFASIQPDGHGWCVLVTTAPGVVTLQ